VLLARREWCLAFSRFDMSQEREQPGSLFASDLCRHMCRHYIPRWDDMMDLERYEAEAMFLTTGQTCTKEVYRRNSGTMQTKVLFVEQAADAFQPFDRTQHSTWVMALRCAPLCTVAAHRLAESPRRPFPSYARARVQGDEHGAGLCVFETRYSHPGRP
jgi:hypothetical protein